MANKEYAEPFTALQASAARVKSVKNVYRSVRKYGMGDWVWTEMYEQNLKQATTSKCYNDFSPQKHRDWNAK